MLCSSVNFFAGRPPRVCSTIDCLALCWQPACSSLIPQRRWVLRRKQTALLVVAGPSAAAVAAWDKYVAAVDARHSQASPKDFFALDMRRAANWRERAKSGNVPMVDVDPPGAPDAQDPSLGGGDLRAEYHGRRGREAAAGLCRTRIGVLRGGEGVQAARAATGTASGSFCGCERGAYGVSATLNTEHAVEYQRLGQTRAASRSVATKIAELQNVGRPNERERAPGSDRGFLWRLNAYWRFEQAGDGVLIECESVSLSRGVPLLARLFISRAIDGIARESLERTLRACGRSWLAAPEG